MLSSWITLLPPLIVIIVAIITRHIYPALIVGIITAVLIATQGNLIKASQLATNTLWKTGTNIDSILVYSFLVTIGVLVALFNRTGSARSFCKAITEKIKSAQEAQYSSMILSTLLSIDDYLSILTAGYILRPLVDQYKVSRLKLAFFIHSLAGPVVILVPVSSWVATILAYINQAGVDSELRNNIRILADPFYIYLRSIPFIFYSFFIIFSTWFIVYKKISFGPMHKYKDNSPEIITDNGTEAPSTLDLILPLVILISGIVIGLPLAGGFWLFGGSHGLVDALKYNEHPFLIMLMSAVFAVIVSFLIGCYRKSIGFKNIPELLFSGFNLMYVAIGMVFLASTLSHLLANDVGTGQYLASIMLGSVSLTLIPFMSFLVALICTIATGTSWGSFALLIPIAIPMLVTLSNLPTPVDPTMLPLLYPVLGAIFSGAVCGDHISPLSETTMMTATSTNTTLFTHAYTQFFYALPAIIASGICYLLIGFFISSTNLWTPILCGIIGIGICAGILWYCDRKN